MRKHIITVLILIFATSIGMAQKSKKPRHAIRPGISFSYLPTWVLDDFRGNTTATVSLLGVHAHKEIGRESYLSVGLMRAAFEDAEEEKYTWVVLPIQLEKFFNEDRKGLNLGMGIWLVLCRQCNESFGGALSQEFNYMFSLHALRINFGVQTILGNIDMGPSIHAGPQLQVLWVPETKKKK